MKQVLDLLLIVLSLSFCYNVKYECSVNDLIACEMKQYGLAYVYSCNCYPKLIPNLIPIKNVNTLLKNQFAFKSLHIMKIYFVCVEEHFNYII